VSENIETSNTSPALTVSPASALNSRSTRTGVSRPAFAQCATSAFDNRDAFCGAQPS